MKVKDLKLILEKVDPETTIILAGDSEGNGYMEVGNIADNLMFHNGEIGLQKLTKKDKEKGYDEEDVLPVGVKAFVMWPC